MFQNIFKSCFVNFPQKIATFVSVSLNKCCISFGAPLLCFGERERERDQTLEMVRGDEYFVVSSSDGVLL